MGSCKQKNNNWIAQFVCHVCVGLHLFLLKLNLQINGEIFVKS